MSKYLPWRLKQSADQLLPLHTLQREILLYLYLSTEGQVPFAKPVEEEFKFQIFG